MLFLFYVRWLTHLLTCLEEVYFLALNLISPFFLFHPQPSCLLNMSYHDLCPLLFSLIPLHSHLFLSAHLLPHLCTKYQFKFRWEFLFIVSRQLFPVCKKRAMLNSSNFLPFAWYLLFFFYYTV